MEKRRISALIDQKLTSADLEYEEHPPSIRLTLENGWTQEFTGADVYQCFGKILEALPQVNFLCKGAKVNVRPSSMSSQMTSGIMAYEHQLGTRVTRKDVVHIFDFDDQDIVNDPQLQQAFFYRWLESIKQS
ncbi:hypothetical protein [Pseudomonas sp. MYb118]|uniref:hypothetical protein n=1 Tax=Pseudomonas sp. MYb118 TaxID=1848720 RepID=UPI0034CD1273